ncbi:MAG: HAD-IA family hydrolase [Betaproteobacteria bacterium]|nr:HAD-IA family hydrolase [Betaproteobacteria bacterium]
MAERRYRVLVFDWDGTLIDSASAIVECIQQAARDMGLPVPSRERASHVIGLGLQDSLRHAVPELPPVGYNAFAAVYRRNFLAREEAISLFPGVRELLAELAAQGRALAIATGKSRRGLDRALDASGLRAHFVATRCADETQPKPHPAMLDELGAELGAPREAMLMIGDTSHDLEMAANAGVDAVGVTYGAHPQESLRALAPRGLVSSVAELRIWLRSNA